ncbi:hypothetical protein [Bdellovibrio sp.]|uniref:hypothetical protein n=1 Tax=Bdellovibrio sp. TaxID=28201 RepID=UPI0039E6FA03
MKLICIAVFFYSSFSFALTMTQKNLAPSAGQSEIQFGTGYVSSSLTATMATANTSGYEVATSYVYGLSNEHSLGLGVGYGSAESKYDYIMAPDVTFKKQGLSDLLLAYQGNFDLSGFTFFTHVGAHIPTEKYKIDSDKNEQNLSSGRVSPLIGLGIIVPSSVADVGARLKYKLPQDGDAERVSSGLSKQGTISGGNELTLALFAEIQNAFHPNFEVSYMTVSSSTAKFSDSTITYLEQKLLSLDAAFRIEIAPGFEVLPVLTYSTLLNKSDLNIDSYNTFAGNLRGRFTF